MKLTISWDKKCECYRVAANGLNRGFDTIVQVDAFIDGLLYMAPAVIDIKITDRTPSKSFQWRIDQLRTAGRIA